MSLSDIIAQLKSEHRELNERRASLALQLKEIESAIKPIEAAIRELGHKPPGSKHGKNKPAATKADVVAAIEEVLKSRSPANIDALKEAVESQIVSSGRSRTGFALRFREAIQSDPFINSGYRLEATDVDANVES